MIEIRGGIARSEECPQGLKPRIFADLTSESFEGQGKLKPRPTKEQTQSRAARIVAGRALLLLALAAAIGFASAPMRAQDAATPAAQQESQQLAPNATPPDDTPAVALTPPQAARAKSLGKRVKCMCGGCDDAAGMCTHSGGAFAGPCDTAKAELKEIDRRVSRGDSDDLILQSFVQEYGPTVLIEPPKAGFDWLVWIMPVVFPIVALILVWQVVRRWHRRAELAPASGPPVSADLMERARRAADKEPDE
jgi:cytochrome c-type biogenesis protein CcmH/NrfF